MTDAKPSSVPLLPQVKLSKAHCPKDKEEIEKMQAISYASACGSLVYAMVSTRPDIAYPRGVVSKFMSQPGRNHWATVQSILRYFNGTKENALVMAKWT